MFLVCSTFCCPSHTYSLWANSRIGCYRMWGTLSETRMKQRVAFVVHVTVHRDKFLIIKPTRRTNFSNLLLLLLSSSSSSSSSSSLLLLLLLLYVSDSSSVHHQEFFTVHTAVVYVIEVCWQLASRIRMEHPDPARKLSANLYDIYHCCVYSEKLRMMDRGTFWNMWSFLPK